MDSEAEALEEKLTSLLGQLRAECAILERVVYKNKNQHRRSSYFQYLMKVYNFHTVYNCELFYLNFFIGHWETKRKKKEKKKKPDSLNLA
jgi:hypothetical protein